MITLAAALTRVHGLDADTVHVWIRQEWVRPLRRNGEPVFEDIDLARLRLILDLRDQLAMNDDAIPVVLGLLDELHTTRATLRRLAEARRQGG